ncbi:MAG: NAD(P)/FAD-dependent oxidoreductase [Dongiaceae bacterium]
MQQPDTSSPSSTAVPPSSTAPLPATSPQASSRSGVRRIVIVGGGAGGLELATKLGNRLGRKGLADIVLVDANPTHLWKPLLHEVAAGTLNSYQDELSYLAHARQHGYGFQFGRMTGLDRDNRDIILAPVTADDGRVIVSERRLAYDILIIAVGSVSNDFGTPGAAENCRFLDSRHQAEALHRDLLALLAVTLGQERPSGGKSGHDPAFPESAPRIGVAIIGGGATGVELAAELRRAVEDFSHYAEPIHKDILHISIIEMAPRLLPPLPEKLAASVTEALGKLNIEILTNAKVARIDPNKVELADGRSIPAQIRVWAAGIKAPDFLRGLGGLENFRTGQLIVRSTLQTTLDDDIFAFGDCAYCLAAPQGQPGSDRAVPARAQAAHQQSDLLAGALVKRIEALQAGRTPPPYPLYTYSDFGSLVSLSRYTALGTLMGGVFRKSHMVEGWFARMAYISLYRMHQMAVHGIWRTALLIITNRLQRMTQPSLKMH